MLVNARTPTKRGTVLLTLAELHFENHCAGACSTEVLFLRGRRQLLCIRGDLAGQASQWRDSGPEAQETAASTLRDSSQADSRAPTANPDAGAEDRSGQRKRKARSHDGTTPAPVCDTAPTAHAEAVDTGGTSSRTQAKIARNNRSTNRASNQARAVASAVAAETTKRPKADVSRSVGVSNDPAIVATATEERIRRMSRNPLFVICLITWLGISTDRSTRLQLQARSQIYGSA